MMENKNMDVEATDDVDGKPDHSNSNDGQIMPRFEIKKWNAVAMWSWDICADTCAICRNSLNEPSIEYQAIATTPFFCLIYTCIVGESISKQ
jgi:RING-box protein 1